MANLRNIPAQMRSNDFPSKVIPARTEYMFNTPSNVFFQDISHATPQGARSLLTLPAELRNRIYELALSTGSQFCYQRPQNISLQLAASHSTPLMACIMERPGTSNVRGPLEPFGAQLVVFTSHKHAKEFGSYRPRSFNQLQFVNKQLYNETKGLEFEFNNIAFTGSLTAMDNFTHRMQSSLMPFITSVTLISFPDNLLWELCWRDLTILARASPGRWTFDSYINFLSDLAAFCKQNPKIQVDYAITWHGNPYQLGETLSDVVDRNPHSRPLWNFVKLGVLASIAFDPQGSFAQSAPAKTYIWNDCFVQKAVSIGRILADRGIFTDVKNLTFYQCNPQLTREHYGTGEIPSTALIGDGEAHALRGLSKEAWAAHATNWLQNGIRPS
ncbi:hypothetical protein PSPO01_10580 [Paraphaeosphaeria sporulosa]